MLVERSLSTATQSLSLGDALRRVLECVSGGALLPSKFWLFLFLYNYLANDSFIIKMEVVCLIRVRKTLQI